MTSPLRPPLTLREERAMMVQERIMEGVASLLRRDLADVTFDLIARESGVPQRTLYRHFPTKEVLFQRFWQWTNDRIRMPALPTSPEELVAHIPKLFAAFDRDEPLVRAMLHHPLGRAIRLQHAEARRRKFSAALRDILTTLPKDKGASLIAAVTALCSASGWESIKEQGPLSSVARARTAQWATQALIDNACQFSTLKRKVRDQNQATRTARRTSKA